MTFEEYMAQQAGNQLKSTVAAVSDPAWLEHLVDKIKKSVSNLDIDEDFKKASNASADILLANKDKISGMGAQAFTLFIQQLAMGRQQDAVNTYVQAVGSVDDLIADIDRGTHRLIEAKKRLDLWWANGIELVKNIAITGAKILLPFALALL